MCFLHHQMFFGRDASIRDTVATHDLSDPLCRNCNHKAGLLRNILAERALPDGE